MELFKPSKKMLERICSNEELGNNPLVHYQIIENQFNGLNKMFVTGLLSKIYSYYDINHDEESRMRLDVQTAALLFSEGVKNGLDHSEKGKEIMTVGIFFGDKGLCYGFNDGGDYFKSEEIKNQYEKRKKVTVFDEKTLKTNFQSGVNDFIFPYSDIIEVDNKKGILYCAQFKVNLIAPKGEIGGTYFDRR